MFFFVIFKVLKKILELKTGDASFDYKAFFAYSESQNFEHAFDDLMNLNVHVMDQILNVFGYQLKYFCPRKTAWADLLQELLQLYEKQVFLGLVWIDGHYQVLGKYGPFFVLYDSDYEYPIRHTYRELVEYLCEENVRFFWINDTIDEEYHLDWYLEQPIYGGGKEKKIEKGKLTKNVFCLVAFFGEFSYVPSKNKNDNFFFLIFKIIIKLKFTAKLQGVAIALPPK